MVEIHAEAGESIVDAGPAPEEKIPHYTRLLRAEMARAQMTVRAKGGRAHDGLAAQSGLSERRCEDILSGAPVEDHEHRKIVRALPRMKAHGRLLLSFLRPSVPPDELARPVPPAPRPDFEAPPRHAVEPAPRSVQGPDAPPAPAHNVPNATIAPREKSPPGAEAAPRAADDVPGGGGSSSKPLTLQPRTFGEHLRAAREAEGSARTTVAQLLGVNVSAVQHWECDEVRPVRGSLDRLVELFPALAPAAARIRSKTKNIPTPRGPKPARPEEAERPAPAPARSAVPRVVEAADAAVRLAGYEVRDADPLIGFGLALGALRGLCAGGAAGPVVDAVLAAVAAGGAAGLSIDAVVAAVRKRV